MSEKTVDRNNCFDLLKGLACIAVVFMHCEFPGKWGTLVQCLTRWSVPLFFAISGYYCRRDTVDDCKRKAKHIAVLAVYSVIFYVIFEVLFHWYIGDLGLYAKKEFTIINVAVFLMFNGQFFVSGHLWFLFALLYVYFSYAIMIKFSLLKYRKYVCVILLFTHFLLSYGGYILGYPLQSGFYRNFLFEGIPFFLLGKLFYEKSSTWSDTQKKSRKTSGMYLILGGVLLSVVERVLIGRDFSVHFASIIVLIGLLMWAVDGKYPALLHGLVVLGKNYSFLVYIIHVAVYTVFDELASNAGIADNLFILWLRPFNTVLWSLVLVVLFQKSIHNRKEKSNV